MSYVRNVRNFQLGTKYNKIIAILNNYFLNLYRKNVVKITYILRDINYSNSNKLNDFKYKNLII